MNEEEQISSLETTHELTSNVVNITDEDRILINRKYEELVECKTVVLLKPLSQERIDSILALSKEYENMAAFVIGDDDEKRVVLRYKVAENQKVDVRGLLIAGTIAYKNRNYESCIKYYKILLQTFAKPRANIYAKLGLAYAKLGSISTAIDYLTIATVMSKKHDNPFDFKDYICYLKEQKIKKEKNGFAPPSRDNNFEIETLELNIDINSVYFAQVDALVSGFNLDVESACEQLEVPYDEMQIIKLMYAKGFYTQGDITQGDLFLKSVESSKDKSGEVKKLLSILKINKKLYPSKESTTQYKLTLKPSKKGNKK